MRGIVGAVLVFAAVCLPVADVIAQTIVRSGDTSATPSKTPAFVGQLVKPKPPKPIKHEASGGLRFNSNGWSLYGDFGKVKAKDSKQSDLFYDVRFWQVEFTEKKDPKEIKSVALDAYGNEKKYIYGKINNFYSLKLGWGYRKMLAGKPETGCVSIHWVGAFGGALGVAKPYFVKIHADPPTIKYSDNTKSDFLNQQLIEGKAGFSKGLDQAKFNPGGHLKSAIHIDFAKNKKDLIAVETGVNVEYYSQPVQLLANRDGKNYFVDIFVAVQFGKRW